MRFNKRVECPEYAEIKHVRSEEITFYFIQHSTSTCTN